MPVLLVTETAACHLWPGNNLKSKWNGAYGEKVSGK
jgi:hypothetical protein